jgi:hypothetical protein
VRFENYDPSTVVAEETDTGLRELDPSTGEVVGLEFWQASRELPADFVHFQGFLYAGRGTPQKQSSPSLRLWWRRCWRPWNGGSDRSCSSFLRAEGQCRDLRGC